MTMSPPPEPSLNSTARHACHCGRSFARKEHLTRHQATHDKLAHICHVCQRRFSRKDLLRRHSSVHESSHTRSVVSCDACRQNKTKCSGGTQCSLCARRGINCSFRSKKASTSDGPTAAHAPIMEDDANNDAESISPTSSRPENSQTGNALLTGRELLLSNIEFFQNLTIVPSKPDPTSEFQPLSPGMEAIYELLIAETSSLSGAIQGSDALQASVTKYVETYFKNFHLRWPIFNAPTFDIRSLSLPLAASVCLIGAWFQSSAEWTERFYALRVHELLLQRLLHNLIDPETMQGGQAWPIELFQSVLLTLVFSLHHSEKSALSRAMLLRSAFVAVLRELGAFNAETSADQLRTYFSGTYAPYTLSMRERLKRLLVLTYQLDTYFALAHEQPPILHRQEVGVELPSTFALWNSYGLDIFAKRQLEEPLGRSGFLVSELTNCLESFTSSQLLVEDVQLGLCGLLQAIWVLKQPVPSKTTEYLNGAFPTVLLLETLDAWKHELDKINELAVARNITSNAAKYLLLAYRSEDDSAAASLDRITTLVQDAMVLYCYLRMYYHASLNASEAAALVKQTKDRSTETRRTSKYGRESLMCAFQMLKMFDSIGALRVSLNPLIRHALAMGVHIVRALLSRQRCECIIREGQHAASMNHQQWAEIGGSIWIDGTPVCACKLDFWTDRFEKAIQDQEIMVEHVDDTESS